MAALWARYRPCSFGTVISRTKRAVAIGLALLFAFLTLTPVSASTAVATSGPINVCGFFSALSPATATRSARLAIDGATYELVGQGSITPPDISSRVGLLTHPLVRLTGTVEGSQVTNYQVTQVASCALAALPGTSTAQGTASVQEVPADDVVCGRIMGDVGATATAAGSLVIPQPGDVPPAGTYIVIPQGTPFSSQAGWVCVRTTASPPTLVLGQFISTRTFVGFVPPGTPGYRAEPSPAPLRGPLPTGRGGAALLPGTSTAATGAAVTALALVLLGVLALGYVLRRGRLP
jgi:hypothetical protein